MDNELRDKLVELFAVTSLEFEDAVVLANYLIQNGVTIPVRCKDCKHRVLDTASGEDWCNHTLGLCGEVYATDFCSYGERRTNVN